MSITKQEEKRKYTSSSTEYQDLKHSNTKYQNFSIKHFNKLYDSFYSALKAVANTCAASAISELSFEESSSILSIKSPSSTIQSIHSLI